MPVINKNYSHEVVKPEKKGKCENSPEKASVNVKNAHKETLLQKINKFNFEVNSAPQGHRKKGENSPEKGSAEGKGGRKEEQEKTTPLKQNRKGARKGNEREEPERSVNDEKAGKVKAPQTKKSREKEKVVQEMSNGERDVSMTRLVQEKKKPPPPSAPQTHVGPSMMEKKLKYFQQAVKRFVSAPVPDDKVRQLTNTLQRKMGRTTTEEIIKSSRQGEDVYVTRETRQVIRENLKEDAKQDGAAGVQNQKDKIFINGKPFWYFPSRAPQDEDLKGVEDSLEFNANTVLAVGEKKIVLQQMPTMPVVLDPMNDMDAMKQKDCTYFNKDIVFGNTFRSMIWSAQPPTSSNLDDISRSPSTISFSKSNVVDNVTAIIVESSVVIEDPTVVVFYKRKDPNKRRVEKFAHRETKKKKKKKKTTKPA